MGGAPCSRNVSQLFPCIALLAPPLKAMAISTTRAQHQLDSGFEPQRRTTGRQNRTVRIATFSSAFHPSLGGVEELVRQLSHAYVAQGHQALVVTNKWPRDLPALEHVEGLE